MIINPYRFGGVTGFLLDDYAGASAGYSLRALSASYETTNPVLEAYKDGAGLAVTAAQVTDGTLATWASSDTKTSVNLSACFMTSSSNAWAVGGAGHTIYTTNGGSTWTLVDTGADSWRGIHMVDSSNGFVCSSTGAVLVTTNGGVSWVTSGTSPVVLWDIVAVSTSAVWTVGNSDVIQYYNGSSWAAQTSSTSGEDLQAVDFVDANNGWAVGTNGAITATTDGGTNWSNQTSGTSQQLQGVSFISSSVGWAVGFSGTIIKTTDGGSNWSAQTSGTSRNLTGVSFVDANNGWASGAFGVILKTTDGGTNWVAQTSGLPTSDSASGEAVVRDIHFTDTSNGIACAYGGTVLITTDGGATWTVKAGTGVGDAFVRVWRDQTGNDNDALQATEANMPQIVSGGVVDADGLLFNGTSEYLDCQFAHGTASAQSIFAVAQTSDLTANRMLVDGRDGNDDGIGMFYLTSSDYIRFHVDTTDVFSNTSLSANTEYLFAGIYGSTTSTFYEDGTQTDTDGTAPASSSSTTNYHIGRTAYSSTSFWQGSIQEVIIYPDDQTANQAGIDGNITTHYGI